MCAFECAFARAHVRLRVCQCACMCMRVCIRGPVFVCSSACVCFSIHTRVHARECACVHHSLCLHCVHVCALRASMCIITTIIHKPSIIHELPQKNHSTTPPSPPPSRGKKTYKGNLHNEHIVWTNAVLELAECLDKRHTLYIPNCAAEFNDAHVGLVPFVLGVCACAGGACVCVCICYLYICTYEDICT